MEAIATYTLIRYIQSCTNPQHLCTADRLVTLFMGMYGATEHYTRLCCELQLKRIELEVLTGSLTA